MLQPKGGDERYGMLFRELERELRRAIEIGCVLPQEVVAIIEKPTFENSDRGKQLFASKGILKLQGAAAVFLSVLASMGIPYAFVTANQWKRNFPKPAIRRRVEQVFPDMYGQWQREDEYEAVALALWGQRHYGEYDICGAFCRT